MHGISGQKDPALAVAVGQQQIHFPLPDIEHVVPDRHGHDPFEHIGHVHVVLDHGMQGEMPGRVLDDEKAPLGVGHVIVAALADRDAFVEVLAVIQRLAQLLDIGLAVELDAELPAHQAAAAVAPHHVRRA